MGTKDLPCDKGTRIRDVFVAFGWTARRSEKNHFVLTHPAHPNVYLSIPDHDEVRRNLLKAQIRNAKLTDKQFCDQYEQMF
jgi:hypothetical protein